MIARSGVMFLLLMLSIFIVGADNGISGEIGEANIKDKLIICFGDSLTRGSGVPDEDNYPSRLSGKISNRVLNAGIAGNTTVNALRRIREDVIDKDPYLVIVEFGANDKFQGIPWDITESNLSRIIDDIHGTGAIVALMDISGAGTYVWKDIYHDELKSLAEGKGCIFIPSVLRGLDVGSGLFPDGIHPTSEGYGIIADRVFGAIKEYCYVSTE